MIDKHDGADAEVMNSESAWFICCGCLAYLCWTYLLVYAPGTKLYPIGSATPVSNAYLSSTVVMCCALLVLAARKGLASRMLESRTMSVAVAICMSLGSVAFFSSFFNQSLIIALLGGILTGVAAAVLAAWCIDLLSELSTSLPCFTAPLVAAVTSAICLTVAYFGTAFLVAFVALLPYPAMLSLRAGKKMTEGKKDFGNPSPLLASRKLVVLALLVCVSTIALAMGFLDAYDAGSWCAVAWYTCVSLALFCASAVTTLFLRLKKFFFLQTLALPLLLIVSTIAPYWSNNPDQLGAAFTVVGSVCFETLLLVACASYVRRLGFRPISAFCFVRVILSIVYQLGWQIGSTDYSFDQTGVGIALVMFVLSVEAICAITISVNAIASNRARKEAVAATETIRSVPNQDINELLRERCIVVQKKYGISDRELDVLVLLARGYSSSSIQEKLCIASGTVNSHTRNIYAKLGVHSKSDVITFVQELENQTERSD